VFQRPDGSSVFRPRHGTVFSSTELLAAEDRLLDLALTTNAPTVALRVIERIARCPDADGRMLGPDQGRRADRGGGVGPHKWTCWSAQPGQARPPP